MKAERRAELREQFHEQDFAGRAVYKLLDALDAAESANRASVGLYAEERTKREAAERALDALREEYGSDSGAEMAYERHQETLRRLEYQHRTEIAQMTEKLRAAELNRDHWKSESEAAERENICDACAGSGEPASGPGCMCEGTGKMSRAALHLRKRLLAAERERDELRAKEIVRAGENMGRSLASATRLADTLAKLQAAETRATEAEGQAAASQQALGRIEAWTHAYGKHLVPLDVDSYGEGMRAAKGQVRELLQGALSLTAGKEMAERLRKAEALVESLLQRNTDHVFNVDGPRDERISQLEEALGAFVTKRHDSSCESTLRNPTCNCTQRRVVAGWDALGTPATTKVGEPTPIPMLLDCPACGFRHQDVGEWATRPHKTHLCAECGEEWRPANVPTVGVHSLDEPAGEP